MRALAPFALVVAVLVVVASLGGAPDAASLTIAIRGDVFTLDPQRMSYIKDFRMAHALYEGLLRWDNADFTTEPAVAAEMPEVSSDGLVWTFRLRTDARWSNGDAVTAHDFVAAWRRAILPDTAADYSNLFFAIEGAAEFFEWRDERLAAYVEAPRPTHAERLWTETLARFDETVGIRAIDDHTLQVRLEQPLAYFADLVCFPAFFPVHSPTVESFGSLDTATGRFRQDHAWARPGTHVGNGPYRLATWRYRRDLRLERNEAYHSPERVGVDSISIVTIEDTNTAVLAFTGGGIDWLTDVNAEYQADMLDERQAYVERHAAALSAHLDDGLTLDEALAALPAPERGERRDIHAFPTFGTDFYSFNCRPTLADGRPNPFHDRRVRQAFALAVDKSVIVERVTRLREPVMNAFIPPNSIPGYPGVRGLAHDRDDARRRLADAGWIDRDGDGVVEDDTGTPFPTVDLLYTTNSPRYKWISLELQTQWQDALGVRIELRGADTKFYKEDLKSGKFMIARGRWYGDYGDPTTFLGLFRSTDGNNDRGFASDRIDDLLARADMETDPAARMTLLAECERIVMEEELPLVPLCQLLQIYMYEPGAIGGLSRHPRLTQYLWQLERRP